MTLSETPPTTTAPPVRPRTAGSDFAPLLQRVTDAGLMRRRPGYYLARIGGVAVLYLGGWAVFAMIGDTWWQMLTAVVMAVVSGQFALVAHDVAHRQVFQRRRASEVTGRIVANLLLGFSYGWWQDKHTRHHANPNHEELDPDVVPDVLVFSTRQAGKAKGVARLVGAYQGYLFFPLITLEGMNLHVAGVRALLRPTMKQRVLEGVLLGAHFVGYLAILFLVLSPLQAVAFLAVHQGLFGVYLGSVFAPNHKGMPTLSEEDERPDFLRKQVLTSRNIVGGVMVDVAMGGLNHQIEHHLFPSMPSPHLRKARLIVKDYCAELGIPYAETGLFSSYREVLRHLHEAGASLRAG